MASISRHIFLRSLTYSGITVHNSITRCRQCHSANKFHHSIKDTIMHSHQSRIYLLLDTDISVNFYYCYSPVTWNSGWINLSLRELSSST
jgi:hypothetical protein